MKHAVLLILQTLTLLFLARTTVAQKYNLTSSIASILTPGFNHPGDKCDLPGICFPTNQTIPGRTLWYWCGFHTTHRTIYTVTTGNPNVTVATMFMMRETVLRGCALPNVSWAVDKCASVPESSCSSKSSCNVRLFGLVFPDPQCFVIINSKSSAMTVTLQLNNFFDSPRYYGTVFTLFFGIVGSLAIVANVVWQFYTIIIAPVNRHVEPVKVKREDPIKKDIEASDSSGSGSGSAAATAARAAWYHEIISKLRPSPPHKA